MEESIYDTCMHAAQVMHWLGQHRVGNALILFGRLANVHKLYRLDDLEAFVEREEEATGAERSGEE